MWAWSAGVAPVSAMARAGNGVLKGKTCLVDLFAKV